MDTFQRFTEIIGMGERGRGGDQRQLEVKEHTFSLVKLKWE